MSGRSAGTVVWTRASVRARFVHWAMSLGMRLSRPILRGRLAGLRFQFEVLGRVVGAARGVRVERTMLDGVPTEVLTPRAASTERALVYLHGGGYTIGSARSHRGIASRLALLTSSKAYVPDYRRAPEHRAPAAVDDVVRAFAAVREPKILLAGESAGGGLAVALCQRALGQASRLPEKVYLLSPWLDLTRTSDAHRTRDALDPMLKSEWVETEFASPYAGDRDRTDAAISPLFGAAAGFPPTLLHVATDEILFDDTIAWERKLREAGVPVTLEIGDRLWHAWPFLAPLVPESVRALNRAAEWLRD